MLDFLRNLKGNGVLVKLSCPAGTILVSGAIEVSCWQNMVGCWLKWKWAPICFLSLSSDSHVAWSSKQAIWGLVEEKYVCFMEWICLANEDEHLWLAETVQVYTHLFQSFHHKSLENRTNSLAKGWNLYEARVFQIFHVFHYDFFQERAVVLTGLTWKLGYTSF